jgi:hypothetical protein
LKTFISNVLVGIDLLDVKSIEEVFRAKEKKKEEQRKGKQ